MPTKIFLNKKNIGLTSGNYISTQNVNVPPLLLNLFPGASAAYSLRKLDTGYAGSAIQVRRVTDNVTQDIGFVNNVLNVSALFSFLGSNPGAVSIWYDQSGNGRNLTNPTATEQPIVYAGGPVTFNGAPYFKLDGVDDRLFNAGFDPTNAGVITTFTVAISSASTLLTQAVFLQQDQTSGSRIGQWARFSGGISQAVTFNTAQTSFTSNGITVTDSAPYVYTSIRRSTDIQSYVNGSAGIAVATTGTPISNAAATVYVGRRSLGEALQGLMSEVVMYPADRTTTRAAIEQNIRNYYGF
jgi:hypothetical protein